MHLGTQRMDKMMNFKQILTVCADHKILTVCAATRDQPTVHKVSQPVPSIKIESYILARFLNTMTFLGEIMQKKT